MRCHNEIQRALREYTKKCLSLSDQAVHLEAYAGTTTGTDLAAPKRVTVDISVIVGAGVSFKVDGLVGQAEAFLRDRKSVV